MIDYWSQGNVLLLLLIKATLIGVFFIPLISLVAMYCIWWERKVAGHIQSRVGPMHVGGWHGWAQSLADGLKLILKEDLMPAGADGFMFKLAPYMAFAPVFAALLALPFSPQWVFESSLNIGVLYLLAVLSVEVMGTILAGWGSNSKWAVYGAMREACQMVSYEVPLGLSIIAGVLTAGTLHLVELGYLQAGGLQDWFIFHNPFIFLAFGVYYVAALASNKRAPFDLPESESELVAGFHTEYSGLRWSFFFFAEYGAMFVVSCIQAALFLGAWNSPLGQYDPIYLLAGYNPIHAGELYLSGALAAAGSSGGWTAVADALGVSPLGLVAVNTWGVLWFLGKALTIIYIQIWVRWTLPRIRIDQVLYTCVKVLLPASLILLVGTATWIWLVPQPAAVTLPDGQVIERLGHLVSPTPTLQLATQIILAALGTLLVLAAVIYIAYAYLTRDRATLKTLFPQTMPVGRSIAFTRGQTPSA